MISHDVEPEDDCLHCSPKHGDPNTYSWGVWMSPSRDGDGQPIALTVMKSDGAHVAESDAEWLREKLQADDTERLTHNENTLFKVQTALYREGLNDQAVIDVISEMQNAGIYFREKAENLS